MNWSLFKIVLLFSVKSSFSQLYTECVTPLTVDSLVQNLFSSPSVEIYNVTFKGFFVPITDSTADIQDIGYFNAINSTVGIDSGIVLTGGFLDPPYGLGQPASNIANYFKPYGIDTLLDAIISPYQTVGRAVLEFDFIPNGDSIKFNYVFASDEYPHQVCHPDNDVFAFHISGPGIIGLQNIALVPNTSIPVGNNSINDTSYHLNPSSINTALCQSIDYPQYYIDHLNDSTFIFNGSTTVLTAKAATIPCETYHLRFAVAEGESSHENSAVFLEANSFNSEPLKIESSVSYGGVDTVLYEGCGYAQIVFRRTYNIQQPKTYTLSISGSAQNGVDYNPLPTSFTMPAGNIYDTLLIYPTADFTPDNLENIILTIGDTLCNGQYYETDVELIVYEKPAFTADIIPHEGAFCDTVAFTSSIEGAIYPLLYNWNNGASNDSVFNFFPSFYGNQTEEDIHIEVNDACGNVACDTINITFAQYPVADFIFTPSYSNWLDPVVEFYDQSTNDVVAWEWSFENDSSTSNIPNPVYHFPDTGNYEVSLLVSNPFDCIDSIVKIIRINEVPTLYIPNAFTPNHDGINEEFRVIGNEIETFELLIFNRWGEVVFESNIQDSGWDGANAPTGVYTFSIKVTFSNGKRMAKTGSVVLLR